MPFGCNSHGALSHVDRPVRRAWQGSGKVLAMLVVYVQAMIDRVKLLLAPALLGRTSAGPARVAGRPRHLGRVGGAALAAGIVASVGLGTSPATAVASFRAFGAAGPVPGTIFSCQRGRGRQWLRGHRPRVHHRVPPRRGGRRPPEAVITKGLDGPNSVTFDAMADLWVASQTGTVVDVQPGWARQGFARPLRHPLLHRWGLIL